jgi:putative DNA primase/helicase
VELDRRLALLPRTDLGNADRFVARFGSDIKYIPNFGWYFWDRRRWSRRGADEFVLRAEHETVRKIQDEASSIAGTKHDRAAPTKSEPARMLSDALRGWGRSSEGASRIAAIAKNARAHIAVEHPAFDADPFKFNVENGTLVFRKPEVACDEPLVVLRPHDRGDLITKLARVPYEPDATCPIFDRFFMRVQPAERQRHFLMQWLGYSLTGDAEEHKLVVCWGRGRNGKGTLLETVAWIAGDYADSVPVETFLANPIQRSGGQATPDLAKLPGVRLLRTGEPDKGAKLGEALIKRVTGGDPIDARNLNKGFFSFFAQFKLTLSCNYKPQVRGTDDGIWGRMIPVPWTVFIPAGERDQTLKVKLRAEGSGILNSLLDGLRHYLENGLLLSEEIIEATETYRRESDPVGRFLDVCTKSVPGVRVQSSTLYTLYLAWAKCNDGPTYSHKGFTGILSDRGLQRIQNNNMFWVDLAVTKTENEFVDYEGQPLKEADDGSTEAAS